MNSEKKVIVIVSANVEWKAICELFPSVKMKVSPFGEWFNYRYNLGEREEEVIYFHGGWGKISAAASAQYAIDRWSPDLIMNIGTCGGFEGEIKRDTIILVDKTIVYDLIEQMADHDETINHYTTNIDLSWLGNDYPIDVYKTTLVSGDRDLLVEDIPELKALYGAVAGDWESGAIAWASNRNDMRCLILRGVSDLVGSHGGEAYDDIGVFIESTARIMRQLVDSVPLWLELIYAGGNN